MTKLFTPPMMDLRDKMIFALSDWHNVTLWDRYMDDEIDENLLDGMENNYLDKLEKMSCEDLKSEYQEKIGDWRNL